MARPTIPQVTSSFLGLNDEGSSQIGEAQASVLQNLYARNNASELVRRGGTAPLAFVEVPTDIDFDLLQFVRILGKEYLIGLHNGTLADWLAHFAGTPLSGGDARFAAGIDATACFMPDRLTIGNGIAPNARFDGSTVKTVMCSQPSSGTVGIGLSSGTLNGTYNYKITFLSADGEDSQPSPDALVFAINAASILLSNLPLAPAEDDCSGRRIWRTINGGTTWYLVGTISDNTTTTFNDTTADADVVTMQALDTGAVRFPPCSVLTTHQLRLCGVLSSGEGDAKTLYISNFQKPGYCPLVGPLDQVDDPTLGARIPLPDAPVGLITYGSVLIVFMANQIWRLSGDNPNNYQFDRWFDIGCVAHRTARVYKGSLLWLGADGVYAAETGPLGFNVNRISDDIRQHLDAVSAADAAKAHAFMWADRYYLCFPDRAFYYDFKYKIWGELTAWTWRRSSVSMTGDRKERIFTTPSGVGQVWEAETGTTDNGAAIPVRWRSRDEDLGQYGREKRLHRVICRFKVGTGTVTVNLYRGAGELIQTFTKDISVAVRPGSNVCVLDERCVEGARDEFFALEALYSEPGSDEFRILDIGSMWTLSR